MASPGSGPPIIPGPTFTPTSTPTMIQASPPQLIGKLLPTPTPDSIFMPIEVTIRPAVGTTDKGETITLVPTQIPYSSKSAIEPEQASNDKVPEQILNIHSIDQESVRKETKVGDPQEPNTKGQSIDQGSAKKESKVDGPPGSIHVPTPTREMVGFVIGTQTLLPGHGVTVGGTTTILPNSQITTTGGVYIFLDPQGKLAIVGGSTTIPLSPTTLPQPAPLILKLAGNTYTADALGRFTVGDQILVPGRIIVVGQTTSTLPDGQRSTSGGTIVYLDPQGTDVIVNGQTSFTLERAQTARLTVLDGKTYTLPLSGATTVVVGGTTLTLPGGGISVVGGRTTVLSGAATVVVGGTTLTLPDGRTSVVGGRTTILSDGMETDTTTQTGSWSESKRASSNVAEDRKSSALVDQKPIQTSVLGAADSFRSGVGWNLVLVSNIMLFMTLC
jgi:hypothetical protein